MINFHFEKEIELDNQHRLREWLNSVIMKEGFALGEVDFVFCSDSYLYGLNLEFLNHDTLTDILSFDYRMGDQINGEIYISVDRVAENATIFGENFGNELHRVMVHGILHFCGYKDETKEDEMKMRKIEDRYLQLL